jgi:hypothetical protein
MMCFAAWLDLGNIPGRRGWPDRARRIADELRFVPTGKYHKNVNVGVKL